MPSPFPGMDPYLESPDWFPDLHDGMITFIKAELHSRLPASYYARSRQRVWLDLTFRPRDGGGVAVAEPLTSEPVVVPVRQIMGDPMEESYLVIHRRQGTDDSVVAVIEILSPSNKTPDEKGRNLYVTKQQETLLTSVHLIEIDRNRSVPTLAQ